MPLVDGKLTRIGIFYDGNFFLHVSNYYSYHHERRSRISVSGLHAFVRDKVAEMEGADAKYCHIVDAHYFRGRLRAGEAEDRDLLYRERVFDDVLVREGVTTHYLPLTRDGEKGIDVWLALEAYELTLYKHFNVVVLVACDGDFLPLVRKLETLGTRVMVLGWDFRFVDSNGAERETRTAQKILDEVTYPILMNTVIEDRARQNEPLVRDLFVPRREYSPAPAPAQTPLPRPTTSVTPMSQPALAPSAAVPSSSLPDVENHPPLEAPQEEKEINEGTVQNVKNGYGFIIPDRGGTNIFFYHLDVVDADFFEIKPGDRVQFTYGMNDRGPCARNVHIIRGPRPTGVRPSGVSASPSANAPPRLIAASPEMLTEHGTE